MPRLTIGIDNYPYASRDGCPANAGDKGGALSSFCANADGVGLAGSASVEDIDVVAAGGKIDPCIHAQCDVAVAGCVAKERLVTAGRVVGAGCVAKERCKTVGHVVGAGCVAIERGIAVGHVVAAGCVAIERW